VAIQDKRPCKYLSGSP